MELHGSCHCRRVRFRLQSRHPYPFNLCYCSVCRKTAGGGGYAVNLSGVANTLVVEGEEHIRVYHARLADPETGDVRASRAGRRFCGHCGSALWVYDSRWPDLLHPFASAIDSVLPTAPERTHLMLNSKATWVPTNVDPQDKQFPGYPDESIAAWHQRLGLEC